jgi:hypothetical protein
MTGRHEMAGVQATSDSFGRFVPVSSLARFCELI